MPLHLVELDAWFVHVPRTGGTWLTQVLEQLKIKTKWVASDVKPTEHPVPWTIQGWNRDRAFGFVRHPWSWYESWWKFRFGKWHPLKGLATPELLAALDDCRGRSFAEFTYLANRDQPSFVTRLYEWMLGPVGWETVRWVGRLESLVRDTAHILYALGYRPMAPKDLETVIGRIAPVNFAQPQKCSIAPSLKQQIVNSERPSCVRWYGGCDDARNFNTEKSGPWVRR